MRAGAEARPLWQREYCGVLPVQYDPNWLQLSDQLHNWYFDRIEYLHVRVPDGLPKHKYATFLCGLCVDLDAHCCVICTTALQQGMDPIQAGRAGSLPMG